MVRAMRAHRITTRRRGRAFLATVLHESMGLRHMTEIGSGAKYEGRAGNSHAGDGERYKGRGPIQLTGRANYEFYGRLLRLDLVSHPELVATPAVGWQVAACYFAKRAGVLAAADAGDFRKVTRLVNGGYNGWEDRQRYWNKLAKLGVVPGSPDLKRGARGAEVEALTRKLSRLKSKKTGKPFLPGPRAKFDLKTARAVSAFQREHELKPDGVLDPRSAEALSRAVRKVAAPAVSAGRNGDQRAEQLWRRLERLDRKSDRVRAGLRTMTPPPLTNVDGLSDAQLVETLERADAQVDLLRRALTARIEQCDGEQESEDVLVALARELDSVSTRISDVASDHAATAPVPAPACRLRPRPCRLRRRPCRPRHCRAAPTANAGAKPTRRTRRSPGSRRWTRRPTCCGPSSGARCWRGARTATRPAVPRTRRPRASWSASRRWTSSTPGPTRSGQRCGRARRTPGHGRSASARPRPRARTSGAGSSSSTGACASGRSTTTSASTASTARRRRAGASSSCTGSACPSRTGTGWRPRRASRPVTRRPAPRTSSQRRGPAATGANGWREARAAKRGKKAALAYAKKHAGRRTAETRVNGGPYIDDWCRLVHLQPGTAGAHWCGAFVNACLVKAGLPSRDWLRYTPAIVNNARAGVEGWSWHTSPRVGDLVLFNWPSGDFVDHVGIVVRVNADGSVRTVEGNFQNRVDYWQRKSQILGFARPPWK